VSLLPVFFAEPDRVLRHLRHHDLAALRCPFHDVSPRIVSRAEGLSITACCRALEDLVTVVLGA
jgi:hypothetical protein